MKKSSSQAEGTRGFTLVELMVAMTIGLIILVAVSTLFVSSKQTYTTQDRLARLQENARFAMQFIIKDLRMAGYFGCLDEITPDSMHSTLNDSSDFAVNGQIPLEGLDSANSAWFPSGEATLPSDIKSGTDAVTVRFADDDNSIYLDQEMPNTSAVLKVNSIAGLNVNDIIIISDCVSADIMQITQLNNTDPHIVHNSGAGPAPGNSTQKLSKSYSPSTAPDGTKVMKFLTRTYFIKTGASGNPALFRQENTSTAVELVDGIENLQVLYGKDTDSDGIPNVYLKPGDTGLQSTDDWSTVKSVRFGIIAVTVDEKDTDVDSGTYDVDGDCPTGALITDSCYDFTPGADDRNKRRVFQAVVQLRNL
jgi:type IV pilus assembly protein PilW